MKSKILLLSKLIVVPVVLLITVIFIYVYSLIGNFVNEDMIKGDKPIKGEDINILLTGMDIGDIEDLENDSVKRTDTIMVLNYNEEAKNVKLISIPRDTLIEVEGMGEERYWKINSAYALGGEEELIKQVENILGLNINYMFEVNYKGFREIIDSIGGVEVKIEQDMFYDDDTQDLHINFKEGEIVNLNGQKAEDYFRWRQNNDGTGFENGDIDRIAHQQRFLNTLLNKVLEETTLTKIPSILKVVTGNVKTNMPLKEMISLGNKIRKLEGSDFEMKCIYWEYADVDGQSFVVTDKEENLKLFNFKANE